MTVATRYSARSDSMEWNEVTGYSFRKEQTVLHVSPAMARLPRIVVPGVPHHATQRGARRMQVFISDGDYRSYLRIVARQAHRHALSIWAYCLMPNHVH